MIGTAVAPAAREARAAVTRVGVGVLGATGYAGSELVRLLCEHPGASLRAAGSRQHAGQPLGTVCPSLPHVGLTLDDDMTDPSAWVERGVDVVFAALPHGVFAARAADCLAAGLRVIDLSSDFRLGDAADYAARYGHEHPSPGLLAEAVYGLSEWRSGAIARARLVANPGCYATAILLAVLPAVEAGWTGGGAIVVDAMSGVSGAGRSASLATHFAECGGSVAPYKVGQSHPHLGEIEQLLRDAAGPAGASHGPEIVFNPHLVPMSRGILASVSIPLSRAAGFDEVLALYAGRYARSPFVRVLDNGALPETRHVRGSNRCDIALRVAAGGRMLLVFAAIDNLLKGAAGQAVQNWNHMMGWPETTGLPMAGLACA